ncbi:hypothetical protein PSPO01_16437 [Paraphaeosphaeria sporulosa]
MRPHSLNVNAGIAHALQNAVRSGHKTRPHRAASQH